MKRKPLAWLSGQSELQKPETKFSVTDSPPLHGVFSLANSKSSSSSTDADGPAAAPSSEDPRPGREEDDDNYDRFPHHRHLYHNPELEHERFGVPSHRGNVVHSDDGSAAIRDDSWSCLVVVLTFWFFVSMTLIMGVFGSVNVLLGPTSSVLIQPNPVFVKSVKAEEVDEAKSGLMLYGFYKTPALDVETNWSESHIADIPADSHKEWIYHLNQGSQISISYSVISPSSSILLIVAKDCHTAGNEDLAQWLEDPTYPNTTLSWNVIQGNGVIHQHISKPSIYYVALGNFNSEKVKVKINLTFKSFLYNTSEAYYTCTLSAGVCSLDILFPRGNSVVITSPGQGLLKGISGAKGSVKISYGPRLISYIFGIGGMTAIVLVAFSFLNKFQVSSEGGTGAHSEQTASERAPLLSRKDDDITSSYGSVSDDDEDREDFLLESQGTPEEGENSTQRLCAICFDASRDCFFLPCGHCASCFACGTRITEAAGSCPICRRNIKKVRKIFTV